MASTPSILSGGGGLDISIGPLTILANVMLIEWFLPHAGLGSAWLAIPLVMLVCAGVGALNGDAGRRASLPAGDRDAVHVLRARGRDREDRAEPQERAATSAGSRTSATRSARSRAALLLIAAPLAIWFALSRTALHRNLYAIGGNDATAFSAGVNVTLTRVVAYALGGAFAAIAGIALTALVQSTQSAGFAQYTLIALAAVALGGTQLGGGRGGLVASLLGACCIYLMQTLLGALSVSSSWLTFVYGALLVVGVVVGANLLTLKPREATT